MDAIGWCMIVGCAVACHPQCTVPTLAHMSLASPHMRIGVRTRSCVSQKLYAPARCTCFKQPLHPPSRLQQQRALWDADARNVPLPAVLTLVVPPHGRPMGPPVYLLYEITGLYGTHKRYVRSVSWEQLSGGRPGPDALDACRPARYLGREDVPNASLPDSGLVDPCGLRAHSLFNDSFTLEADPDTCGLDKEAGAGGGSAVGSGAGGGAPAGSRRALASESAAAAAGGGGSGGGTAFLPLPLDESAAFWPGGTHRLYGAPYNATNLNPAGAEYGPLRGGGGLSRPVGQDPRLEAWMRPSARWGLGCWFRNTYHL